MDGRLIIELSAIFVLVLANGFFALAEFSVIASRKSKLHQKIAQGKRGARSAERLREKPENFLATIQVGITLVGMMAGVFSGATIVAKLDRLLSTISIPAIHSHSTTISMVIVVILITGFAVVLGELVPKYVALSYPERYARLVARPISLFIRLTSFFSHLLSGLARKIVWLLGIRRDPNRALISEEEINQMIIEGREKGIFDPTEEALVRSVFEFADSTVRRAMTPRTDVVGISVQASSPEIMSAISEHGYSRFPVYKETIDTIVGIIYTKDLISTEVDLTNINLSALIREPFFVPDSMPMSQLLREFQKGKNHMAVVLDEFGGTAGLATMEDILEELVGEIQDEYDAEAAPLVKHSETVAYAVGSVWPGQVNEMLSTHLPEEKADTLAGLFIDAAGYVPEKRESLDVADARLTVLAKDENRIIRLKVEKLGVDADSVG